MRDELKPPVTLPPRANDAHKGNFGKVLFVGGSRGMPGAISMTGLAALRSGSGLVTIATPTGVQDSVASYHPAYTTFPLPEDSDGKVSLTSHNQITEIAGSFDAIGCGPGLSTSDGAHLIVQKLLGLPGKPVVLDADALNLLALHRSMIGYEAWQSKMRSAGALVLTPHPREMERISGVPSSDRQGQIKAAVTLSEQMDTVWVLKGGPTVVIANGLIWENDTGNPGMATAGAGDVLTGIISSLLGQGLSAWDAAKLGVWVHGYAGDLAAEQLGQIGLISTDLIEFLPRAFIATMVN